MEIEKVVNTEMVNQLLKNLGHENIFVTMTPNFYWDGNSITDGKTGEPKQVATLRLNEDFTFLDFINDNLDNKIVFKSNTDGSLINEKNEIRIFIDKENKNSSGMKRNDVYKSIDSEREYQERETKNPNRPDMIEEFNMGTALQTINVILKKTGDIWYTESPENNYEGTMNRLRKIAGVCVKMGEKYGMPKRK